MLSLLAALASAGTVEPADLERPASSDVGGHPRRARRVAKLRGEAFELSPDGAHVLVLNGSPDGGRARRSGEQARPVPFDARSGERIAELAVPSRRPVTQPFSAAGTCVVTQDTNGRRARLWDTDDGRSLAILPRGLAFWKVEYAQDGTRLAMGALDAYVVLWHVAEWCR